MLRTPKMFFEIHRGLGKAQPLLTCARNAHACLRHGDWGKPQPLRVFVLRTKTRLYTCARGRARPACGRDRSSGEAVPVGNGGVGRNCGQPGFWRVSLPNLPKSRPFTFLIHKVNYYCAGVFVAYSLLIRYC